jgi:peroxiredoxin
MRLDSSRLLVACLSVVALSVASGCTQSSPQSASSAAPAAVASAAAAEAPATEAEAQPATSEVAAVDNVAEADVKAPATPATSRPQLREAAKPIIGEYGADVPPVLLSSGHAKLCKTKVGDEFPAIQLPAVSGGSAEFAYGPKATVVVFWTTDRWMSGTALRDLAAISADGVSIVGVAVGAKADAASNMIAKSGAKFTQLLDASGAAFAQVGQGALPRVYVLDPQHHIAWFDIEYSEATRRELNQAIAALTK